MSFDLSKLKAVLGERVDLEELNASLADVATALETAGPKIADVLDKAAEKVDLLRAAINDAAPTASTAKQSSIVDSLYKRNSFTTDTAYNKYVLRSAIEEGFDVAFTYNTPTSGFGAPNVKQRLLRPQTLDDQLLAAHSSVFGEDLNLSSTDNLRSFRLDRISGVVEPVSRA